MNLDCFKDKKVFLVCAETYCWPMHYVAEELRKCNSELTALFIQPGESYFKAPEMELFKTLNDDIETIDLSKITEQYLTNVNDIDEKLDWNYINYIERQYTHYSNLNEQFLSEMMFLPYYHDRNKYEFIEYNKILYFAQIYYYFMENLLKNKKPDILLDTDVDFFGRAVLLEVAKKLDIPYISVDHSRFNGFVLPTTRLVKTRDPYVNSLFHEYIKDDEILGDLSIKELYENAQISIGEIPEIFKDMHYRHKYSLHKMFKQAVIMTYVSIRHFSFKKFCINVTKGISSPICSNVVKSLISMYMYFIRRIILYNRKIFTNVDLKNINYIYVPLHVIPESSTTVLSPYYINENFIIESLSKSVKANQFIVVKEHWSMIGYRPLSYYKRIKRLPNVILVDPDSDLLPKDYICNADLVVTISGSAAFEASMLGKNSLIFSDVIFGLLSSCRKVRVGSDLRDIVSNHKNYEMPKRELYSYLKILKEFGRPVNVKKLQVPPSLVNKTDVAQDIKNLIEVFTIGILFYEKNKELNFEVQDSK